MKKKALRPPSTQQVCLRTLYNDQIVETAYSTEWTLKDFYSAWFEPPQLTWKEPKEVSHTKGGKKEQKEVKTSKVKPQQKELMMVGLMIKVRIQVYGSFT